MWLIVRAVAAVPGVRVLGATFGSEMGAVSKSDTPGFAVVEGIGRGDLG